jgi:hypothetical protein
MGQIQQQQQQSTDPQSNGHQQATHRVRESAREAMRDVAEKSTTALTQLGEALKDPTTGAALAGATVTGAVVLFGWAPAALGAAAGYVAYRIVKKQRGQ